MYRIVRGLKWRLQHATVPLLMAGVVTVLAAAAGVALELGGAKVPALTSTSARVVTGLLGVVFMWWALVVGVPQPARMGGVRGAWPELPPNHVPRPALIERLLG